jgi:hypothetical protein
MHALVVEMIHYYGDVGCEFNCSGFSGSFNKRLELSLCGQFRGRLSLVNFVEGISQPWHSLAPRLGAESQGSWISWQQVYSRADSRSMEVRSTRIKF